MSSKPKHSGGPKTDKGKAISSRNSTTHGLTASQWVNNDEQALFNMTVEALIVDFVPQSFIEKLLITKMAECSVRLIRIQNAENSLFDLATVEAEDPVKTLKSFGNEDKDLHNTFISAMYQSIEINQEKIAEKLALIKEIDQHTISSISGWEYIYSNMPLIYGYLVTQCLQENITIKHYLARESEQTIVMFVDSNDKDEESRSNKTLSEDEVVKNANTIQTALIHKYLENLYTDINKELHIQLILKDYDKRHNLVKESALPDQKSIDLIQRYRTSNERQFSKSLGELFELQKRRKTI
jgi:hypothetical protein